MTIDACIDWVLDSLEGGLYFSCSHSDQGSWVWGAFCVSLEGFQEGGIMRASNIASYSFFETDFIGPREGMEEVTCHRLGPYDFQSEV